MTWIACYKLKGAAPRVAASIFRRALQEAQQWELGKAVRKLFADKGFQSVAAPGFEAPGVAVFYTDSDAMKTGAPFMQQGLQVAAGVPLQCDEGDDYKSFRIGLFGIDKLQNVERTVGFLRDALGKIQS